MKSLSVAIGADHAGFSLKEKLRQYLENESYNVRDFGTKSADPVDYPDYVHPLADSIEKKEYDFGVLVCGSANGVAMAANKHQGIRAAIAWDPDSARLAREHNDANIICLPGRFLTDD